MATIALYADKINRMPELAGEVKRSVGGCRSELLALWSKSLAAGRGVCDLADVAAGIQASARTQEELAGSLEALGRESEAFIGDAARIDGEVADTVSRRKEDFYEAYSYLKPECEKSGWEKFTGALETAGEWCREHWKLVVTVVIVIAAIAVLVFFPAAAPIILMAAKGAIIGAVSGGLIGGISSLCSGGSFLEGFEEGAFSGAVCGLVFGGLGGAGQMFGDSCRAVQMLGGTEKAMRAVGNTLKVTGGLSAVMTGFDLLALGVGMFDPSSPVVVLNQRLHSSRVYNALQFTVSAAAAFSGGAYLRMKQGPPACFIAGTLILTAAGFAAVEEVRAGDKVVSTDAETFERAEKKVLETYVREAGMLVHLRIQGEEIITTADHPFYVSGRGFTKAGWLQEGDRVLDADGESLTVGEVKIEFADEAVKVYNFQVEGFHTYHVGRAGVLVHNATNYPSGKLVKGATEIEGGISTIKSSDLVFGSSTKSTQKLINQMNSRGWTEDLIRNTVDNPYTIRTSVNKATGNSATVFYTQQSSYVIVDDVTKAIVQISDNINPSTWAPDLSIVDPYIPD